MIPNIIDVEASGFGYSSYPVEIGFVLGTGEKYCSLISPEADWCHWSEDAENLHQISKDVLIKKGLPVVQVARELNQLLSNKTLYSDGWVVDKPWISKLYYAAAIEPLFSISPLEFILSEYQMENWHKTKENVIDELHLERHRASSDAQIIQETYRRTLLNQYVLSHGRAY